MGCPTPHTTETSRHHTPCFTCRACRFEREELPVFLSFSFVFLFVCPCHIFTYIFLVTSLWIPSVSPSPHNVFHIMRNYMSKYQPTSMCWFSYLLFFFFFFLLGFDIKNATCLLPTNFRFLSLQSLFLLSWMAVSIYVSIYFPLIYLFIYFSFYLRKNIGIYHIT